jgi:hypothetical protein
MTLERIKPDFIIAENYVVNKQNTLNRINNMRSEKVFLPENFDTHTYQLCIKNIQIPLLIFHAGEDEAIAKEDFHDLADTKMLTLINYNGRHGQGYYTLGERYFEEIHQWVLSKD